MHRQLSLWTLVGALIFCGCGSSNTDNLSGFGGNSVASQTPVSVLSAQRAGGWVARWGEGEGMLLFLSRSGRRLNGDGAFFQGLDPLPFQVSGQVGSGEVVDLQLAGQSAQVLPFSSHLSLVWNGTEAQGLLEQPTFLRNLVFQPLAPSEALKLPVAFEIQTGGIHLRINLDSQNAGEFRGSWESLGGTPLTCVQDFSQGRVSYVTTPFGRWGRLALQDPDGVLELGIVWLRDGVEVGPGDIDPDSALLTPSGRTFLTN